jgi:hypothetical protein
MTDDQHLLVKSVLPRLFQGKSAAAGEVADLAQQLYQVHPYQDSLSDRKAALIAELLLSAR